LGSYTQTLGRGVIATGPPADFGQAEGGHREVEQLLAGRLQRLGFGLDRPVDLLRGRPVGDPRHEMDQLGHGLHAVEAGQRVDSALGHRPVARPILR
jgi:hypothetical protein